MFDTFSLAVDPKHYVHWPNSHTDTLSSGFQPVEILINGVSLRETITSIEKPFVEEENRCSQEEKRSKGEEFLEEDKLLPGDYLPLPASLLYLPSHNLLDQPYDSGFLLSSDDPRREKSIVLGCTCGVIECWFLQVRITCRKEKVNWSDFAQFHRDWCYKKSAL